MEYIVCPDCGKTIDLLKKDKKFKCCKCGESDLKSFYFTFEKEDEVICRKCKEGVK